MTKRSIWDLDFDEVQEIFDSLSQPAFRAEQFWRGLYHQFVQAPEEISTIPKSVSREIQARWNSSNLQSIVTQESKDHKTVKTLFRLGDGHAIEAVLMKYDRRHTLCISTQAGCAMGCVFCATGQMGFKRNLTSGEIVEQVIYYARQLLQQREVVTNVVLMGMGEPLHNYDETMKAVDRLSHPLGLNLGARRFTISTVGLVPAINRFADERRQVNLAISLHAADDVLRQSMLPINQRYPISDLMDACRRYVAITNRRLTFEWALIHMVNDTPEQAHKLGKLLQGLHCHVNLIPLNPTKGYGGAKSSPERANAFREILGQHGVPCTIRVRRGIEIQAGCGQLAIAPGQSMLESG